MSSTAADARNDEDTPVPFLTLFANPQKMRTDIDPMAPLWSDAEYARWKERSLRPEDSSPPPTVISPIGTPRVRAPGERTVRIHSPDVDAKSVIPVAPVDQQPQQQVLPSEDTNKEGTDVVQHAHMYRDEVLSPHAPPRAGRREDPSVAYPYAPQPPVSPPHLNLFAAQNVMRSPPVYSGPQVQQMINDPFSDEEEGQSDARHSKRTSYRERTTDIVAQGADDEELEEEEDEEEEEDVEEKEGQGSNQGTPRWTKLSPMTQRGGSQHIQGQQWQQQTVDGKQGVMSTPSSGTRMSQQHPRWRQPSVVSVSPAVPSNRDGDRDSQTHGEDPIDWLRNVQHFVDPNEVRSPNASQIDVFQRLSNKNLRSRLVNRILNAPNSDYSKEDATDMKLLTMSQLETLAATNRADEDFEKFKRRMIRRIRVTLALMVRYSPPSLEWLQGIDTTIIDVLNNKEQDDFWSYVYYKMRGRFKFNPVTSLILALVAAAIENLSLKYASAPVSGLPSSTVSQDNTSSPSMPTTQQQQQGTNVTVEDPPPFARPLPRRVGGRRLGARGHPHATGASKASVIQSQTEPRVLSSQGPATGSATPATALRVSGVTDDDMVAMNA